MGDFHMEDCWARSDDTVESLRADLAAALAQVEAMREALEERDGGAHDQDCKIHRPTIGICNCGHAEAYIALSTPAPAALEALKRRVRDEALEKAAARIEAQGRGSDGLLYAEARWAAAVVRAMKEGEA